jgi:aspartyl-tRNA(Asn)/glutamyl-tRNA(Gln) amidotransferase subunit A
MAHASDDQELYNKLVTADASLHAVVQIFDPPLTEPSVDPSGLLLGISIGVKDMIAIKGHVIGNGNVDCLSHGTPATTNASIIDALLESGASIVATTTLLEYAAGAQHPDIPETRNPQDPTLTAGGSSAGSAALVGAGVLPLAVGTDTGGSIRIPAAYCACYGIKPTSGLIPVDGVTPLAPTLDHLGFLAESIEMIDRAMAATVERWNDESEKVRRKNPLRIGIPRQWIDDARNDKRITTRFVEIERSLLSAGHAIVDIDVTMWEKLRETFFPIVLFEAWQVHGTMMDSNPQHFGEETRRLLEMSRTVTRESYENALRARRELLPQSQKVFDDIDLLMMPAVPYFPPETTPPLDSELGAYEGLYTEIFNVTGNPALVLPARCEPISIGIQIVGPRNGDLQLLCDAEVIDRYLR